MIMSKDFSSNCKETAMAKSFTLFRDQLAHEYVISLLGGNVLDYINADDDQLVKFCFNLADSFVNESNRRKTTHELGAVNG